MGSGTLEGRYAIVTGANKGIGLAIVKRFLHEGVAGVAMLARDGQLCEKVAKELDPEGKRTLPIKCDVSDQSQVKAAFDAAMSRFGTLDILINNAAIIRDRMFHKMSDEEWHTVMDVNLDGVYYLCKYVVPVLREKGYGRIVNISSTSALGNVGQANYAASKAAIQGFTKTLAKELAGKGVIVNCVAPSYIETDMYNSVPPETRQQYLSIIPVGRLGTPDELANVVNFLSGPECTYLTSQVIYVSGGTTTG